MRWYLFVLNDKQVWEHNRCAEEGLEDRAGERKKGLKTLKQKFWASLKNNYFLVKRNIFYLKTTKILLIFLSIWPKSCLYHVLLSASLQLITGYFARLLMVIFISDSRHDSVHSRFVSTEHPWIFCNHWMTTIGKNTGPILGNFLKS